MVEEQLCYQTFYFQQYDSDSPQFLFAHPIAKTPDWSYSHQNISVGIMNTPQNCDSNHGNQVFYLTTDSGHLTALLGLQLQAVSIVSPNTVKPFERTWNAFTETTIRLYL